MFERWGLFTVDPFVDKRSLQCHMGTVLKIVLSWLFAEYVGKCWLDHRQFWPGHLAVCF